MDNYSRARPAGRCVLVSEQFGDDVSSPYELAMGEVDQFDEADAEIQRLKGVIANQQVLIEKLEAEIERLNADLGLLRPVCSATSGGLSPNDFMCPLCDGAGGVKKGQFDNWDRMQASSTENAKLRAAIEWIATAAETIGQARKKALAALETNLTNEGEKR